MLRSGELLADARASAWRWLAGFLLGNLLGLSLGLLTGRSRLARDTLGQMMNLLRCIPFIVLIPLAILWFGIDEAEKVFMVAWGVVFPVWLNAQAGIAEVEKEYVWAAQSLGAKGIRMYAEVLIPRALPFIIAGTRMGIATGVFALAAAEMAGAFSGLAYRIYYSHQMFQTEKMMAGIVTVACLGLVLDRVFVWGMRAAFPWWQGSLDAKD
jgi:NitT/TauT family transport system permease protein